MKTRLLALLLSLLFIFSLIGCRTQPSAAELESPIETEYDTEALPVMEVIDIDNVLRTQVEDGKISYYIPSGSWVKGTDSSGNTVVLFRDTAKTTQQVSAQAKLVSFYGKELDDSFMGKVVNSLNDDLSLSVNTSEMRSFQGKPIFYAELSVEFTDDVIDNLLEQGIWSEEDLEKKGGREAYKAIPKTNTIMIYAVIDGYMVTYGGSYYDDNQKGIVLSAINVMLQSTEIL